jgi:hypothetical protein
MILAIDAQVIVAQVVGKYDHDVRRSGVFRGLASGQHQDEQREDAGSTVLHGNGFLLNIRKIE